MFEPVQFSTDLASCSLEQLKDLKCRIEMELNRRVQRERNKARQTIMELACAHEIDLGKLSLRVNHHPKYRNPDNYLQTWVGVGRKPKWVLDHLRKGLPLSDLEIPTDPDLGAGK